ncbi:type VII secretion target [Mycobacterium sp. pV006]|uniref:type VII secretion target n=1 Tax=Mycobacterium sp. pV006 TaxID=3238983 RepID=UPI00351B47F7
MSARLIVDPDLVRGYGTASSGQAVDLHDVARRLSGLGSGCGDTLGPVGAGFLAALTRAAADEATALTALSGALTGAHGAAHAAAAAYESSDAAAGTHLAGFW